MTKKQLCAFGHKRVAWNIKVQVSLCRSDPCFNLKCTLVFSHSDWLFTHMVTCWLRLENECALLVSARLKIGMFWVVRQINGRTFVVLLYAHSGQQLFKNCGNCKLSILKLINLYHLLLLYVNGSSNDRNGICLYRCESVTYRLINNMTLVTNQ